MALVDDRPGREVVGSLLVVLAFQGEQPAADHAAVVGVHRIRLGVHRLGRLGVAAGRRNQRQRESSKAGWAHARKRTPGRAAV